MTLSPREQQVADLRATGLGYNGIGQRLGISPNTVSQHLMKVYVKLNLDKRAHNGRAEMLRKVLAAEDYAATAARSAKLPDLSYALMKGT